MTTTPKTAEEPPGRGGRAPGLHIQQVVAEPVDHARWTGAADVTVAQSEGLEPPAAAGGGAGGVAKTLHFGGPDMRHVRTSVLVALLSVAVVAQACAASRSPLRPATVPATTPTKTQPSKPTLPSQVINLTNWRLVLPTGPPTKATVVSQPVLASYSGPDFQVNAAGNGVVFTAPVGGSTYGSQYPRSELDEVTPEPSQGRAG